MMLIWSFFLNRLISYLTSIDILYLFTESYEHVTFPPHSTNMNEVNVTVAGSVCDVQSTNNTHIICVTNSQRQSQETKVRVSIGDRGIAKMVTRSDDSQNSSTM